MTDTASTPETRCLPFVSVILPVRNEAGFIGDCLRALAAQDYPHDRFEVILVDGRSTDATLAEANGVAETAGLPVSILTNSRLVTAAAMNLGIRAAGGEVILKVDGHTRVATDFISANVRVLEQTGADCVGGPIDTVGRTVIGRALALATSSPFGIGDASFRHADAHAQETDSVPFGAYRREVFDRVGPFSEDIDRGEDDEFNYRLREAGGRIVLSPAIRSTYYCRDSLAALARQYWHYGLAKAAVLQRHPQRLRPRHLVPSSLVLALVGGILLRFLDRRFGWLTVLAGASYAIANLLASSRLAPRDRGAARYLPAAFACIHLSAGAGFIAGFLRRLLPGRSKCSNASVRLHL
jgi:glycosyltransferase involved in cell wall biosynthesis